MTKQKLIKYLTDFSLGDSNPEFRNKKTIIEYFESDEIKIPKFINEYWTAKQRQNNPIHEVSYRACFKAELPRFFINLLTKK
ncbi:MAG: hypothetical protein P8X47_05835, partial [Ignavibacteriaceae bacterium]